jgi:hypothetical protein
MDTPLVKGIEEFGFLFKNYFQNKNFTLSTRHSTKKALFPKEDVISRFSDNPHNNISN